MVSATLGYRAASGSLPLPRRERTQVMKNGFDVGDRVRVKADVPGGTNRTPFYARGKKGVVAYQHGLARNPRDLSYGGTGELKLSLYGVSFHWAHLYDEDPDFVSDRVLVDIWEDWLEPVTQSVAEGQPIDREEHELSYYERRVAALQNLLAEKGIINIDETRRLVAESDARVGGTAHPMVTH